MVGWLHARQTEERHQARVPLGQRSGLGDGFQAGVTVSVPPAGENGGAEGCSLTGLGREPPSENFDSDDCEIVQPFQWDG